MKNEVFEDLNALRDRNMAFNLGLHSNAFILEIAVDKGCRRSGMDRRQFSYDAHIPERRYGQDRRGGKDWRNGFVCQTNQERESGIERRAAFA